MTTEVTGATGDAVVHASAALRVARADELLAAFAQLIEEEAQLEQAARSALAALEQRVAAAHVEAAEVRERLPQLVEHMGAARATVSLTLGTDGEDAARARLANLESVHATAVAYLADVERTAPVAEVEDRAEAEALRNEVAARQASRVALMQAHDDLVRARAEAFAAQGRDVADGLVHALTALRQHLAALQQEVAAQEAALAQAQQEIAPRLAAWPALAERVAKQHGPARERTPQDELLALLLAAFEYLQRRGKSIPEHRGSVSLAPLLELDANLIHLSLMNASGASAGSTLTHKIDRLRALMRDEANGR